MSRREKSSFQLKPVHYVIGVAVLVLSAAVAIGVVTLFGGSSLSKGSVAIEPPAAIGPEPAIERSAAADVLSQTSWDEMTPGERALVRNEVTRVFDNATFRARSELVFALDVYRRDGRTQVSRQFEPIKTDQNRDRLAEFLIFYCPTADGKIHAYKYTKQPLKTELSEAVGEPGQQPWEPVLSKIDWSQVADLGFKEINGHRAHGLETGFGGSTGSQRTRQWFDVETARLLERAILDDNGAELTAQTYLLDWRQFAPIDIPADQDKPGCVADVQSALTQSP